MENSRSAGISNFIQNYFILYKKKYTVVALRLEDHKLHKGCEWLRGLLRELWYKDGE